MKWLALTLLVLIALTACTAPPEDADRAQVNSDDTEMPTGEVVAEDYTTVYVPLNKEASSFEFEGYAPGKSHIGTFESWDGELYLRDGRVVGGKGVIQATTVTSDGERLENHLRSEDFFHVEMYPEIIFESTSLQDGQLTGDLTFHGVTKSLTFPVEYVDGALTADFVINTADWGMSHPAANDEVRIAFVLAQ